MERHIRRNHLARPGLHVQSTRRWLRFAGGALFLLALAGSCLCLVAAGSAPARQIQHTVRLAQGKTGTSAGNLPAEGNWVDTGDGTALLVQFQATFRGLTTFDFTTPTGQQLQGALPLVTLADGTLAQGTGVVPGATTSLPPPTPRCLDGVLQSDAAAPLSVFYTFLAHMSGDGMGAFATLSYASIQDQIAVAVLCKGVQGPGVTTYQLSAGCTLTSCTDLALLTGPTVATYDAALLAAEENGSLSNWTTVYNLTSRQVTAQYAPADFATLLNEQIASAGKITSITTPLSNPGVEFTPEGQAYFTVMQTVKYLYHGSSRSRALTSYYVLENGSWLFWFSG